MNTLPYLRNFELGGQVALVTGSARGLGLCIARALAGCGARVLINGRNATAAEAAADALRRDGLDAHALAFDVADDAAMAQAFARIDAEHGRLDILVNNVGARNRKTLADTTPAEIRELIDTDLVAGLLLSKLAAERMVRQGGGRLIAITSVVGEFARAGDAVIRRQAGPDRHDAGAGGGVRRARHHQQRHRAGHLRHRDQCRDDCRPSVGPRVAARNPTGRWGEPEEIAGAAVFLAPRAASYVNGHVLVVDGGLSIQF